MRIATLAVIGVGLIGGSIARAARRREVAGHIIGMDQDASVRQRAVDLGIIDEAAATLTRAASAEVIVFCTPVDTIVPQVLAIASSCRPGVLLTDAGSTKAAIVRDLENRLPPGVAFVGSHPLAGSEKHGPEHASATLFDGRLVLVTPTCHTSDEALMRTQAFWKALGARVQVMDPQEHDAALGLTSHLPHLLASALAGILPPELYDLTATGFRDTTRLAASNPALWTSIFRSNRAAVLTALERLEQQLTRFQEALATEDYAAVQALLRQGKQVRDALTR